MDHKQILREYALKQRDTLTPEHRKPRCCTICDELAEHLDEALASYNNIHTSPDVCYRQPPFMLSLYHAMGSEVSIAACAEAAYRRGVTVCFPCMTKQDSARPYMAMRAVPHEQFEADEVPFLNHPLKSYAVDDSGLAAFPLVDASLLDMIVVPVVAFDDENNRIGYGGGNYDRFLPLLRDSAVVVGVAFDEQRVDVVPCEPHDHALPRIVVG